MDDENDANKAFPETNNKKKSNNKSEKVEAAAARALDKIHRGLQRNGLHCATFMA